MAAARAVIAVDGIQGLFGRGLKTRILANGLQGLMFTVLWQFFMDLYACANLLGFYGMLICISHRWNNNTKPKTG